jgi:hypothetical protein
MVLVLIEPQRLCAVLLESSQERAAFWPLFFICAAFIHQPCGGKINFSAQGRAG